MEKFLIIVARVYFGIAIYGLVSEYADGKMNLAEALFFFLSFIVCIWYSPIFVRNTLKISVRSWFEKDDENKK